MELRDLRHLVDSFLANAGYPPSDPHSPGPFVLPLMADHTLGIQWCPEDDEVILFANPGYTLQRQAHAPASRPTSDQSQQVGDATGKGKGREETLEGDFEVHLEDECEDDTDHAVEYVFQDAFKEYEEGDANEEVADAGISLGTDEFGSWVLHIDEDSSLTTLCLHVPLRSFGPQEFVAAVDQFRDKFEIWVDALEPAPPVAGSSAQDEQPGAGLEPQLALMLRA